MVLSVGHVGIHEETTNPTQHFSCVWLCRLMS